MPRPTENKRYSSKQVARVKGVYLGAASAWIFGCFILRTYKSPGPFGYVILSIPLFLYGLAYISAPQITRYVEDHTATTNLLVIAVVFVTVLFEVSHQKRHHYTIYIMLVALIMLIVSMADVWSSKKSFTIARHIKSAARTASLTLLIYVIYVNVVDRLPIKNPVAKTQPMGERLQKSVE